MIHFVLFCFVLFLMRFVSGYNDFGTVFFLEDFMCYVMLYCVV